MNWDNPLDRANGARHQSVTITDRPFMFILPPLNDDRASDSGSAYPPVGGLVLTRGLRISGLLDALPALDTKNLLYLLSFATAYGLGRPTVQQLAHAMHTSTTKVRDRMDRLARFDWYGKPLIRPFRRSDGEDAYMLAPDLVWLREPPLASRPSETDLAPGGETRVVGSVTGTPQMEAATTERIPPRGAPTATTGPAPISGLVKDRIINHSRARYGRPRAEVEAEIARSMGWDQRDKTAHTYDPVSRVRRASVETQGRAIGSPTEVIRRDLLNVGVTGRLADELLDRFPLEAIRRQLDWLPFRNAKNPARLIVSAIEGNYAEPLALRHRARPTGRKNERITTATARGNDESARGRTESKAKPNDEQLA